MTCPDRNLIYTQLPLLDPFSDQISQDLGENFSFHDAVKILCSLSATERAVFSGVLKVVKLFLLLQAANATSEKSFSALRRVKPTCD